LEYRFDWFSVIYLNFLCLGSNYYLQIYKSYVHLDKRFKANPIFHQSEDISILNANRYRRRHGGHHRKEMINRKDETRFLNSCRQWFVCCESNVLLNAYRYLPGFAHIGTMFSKLKAVFSGSVTFWYGTRAHLWITDQHLALFFGGFDYDNKKKFCSFLIYYSPSLQLHQSPKIP
jgi:hypothetical protein